MTIKIEIEAHPDRGDMGAQVERAMSALGFFRSVSPAAAAAANDAAVTGLGVTQMDAEGAVERIAPEDFRQPDAAPEQTEAPAAEIDTRLVGEPAKGNKRRNSAEKAEDDEFEKLAAAKGVPLDNLNKGIANMGRAEARKMMEQAGQPVEIEPRAAISTGEERIGPEDAQDAADEAAETAKTGLAPIDVLRRLVGDYQKKHGMPKAVALCQEGGLIGKGIHELDDAGIEAAISAMKLSLSSPDEAPETKQATQQTAPKTKADLVEAMMRYGDKFDGTRDQAKMTHTLADCPRIFAEVFGPDVTKLSQVPEDGFGKAVAAIEQAIATDPFGRAK